MFIPTWVLVMAALLFLPAAFLVEICTWATLAVVLGAVFAVPVIALYIIFS